MAWRLNTSLTNWRAAVDRAYPDRDRISDGTIGDDDHAQTNSDHNPDADGTVDAWDMDVDLRSGDDRAAIEALKKVFQAHPAARYWIHNRQIAHRSTGWVRKPYSGANPHTRHVHWNSNEATEDSTAPWILEDDMSEQAELQIAWVDARLEAIGKGLSDIADGRPGAGQDVWLVRAVKDIAAAVATVRADVAELKTRPAVAVDQAQLQEALRAVLGSVDGATPQA